MAGKDAPCWSTGSFPALLALLLAINGVDLGSAAGFPFGGRTLPASVRQSSSSPAAAASSAVFDDWSDPSYLELLARVGEAAEKRLYEHGANSEVEDALSPEMLDDPVEAFRLKYSTPLSRDKSAPLHTADVSSIRTPHGAGFQNDIKLNLDSFENDDVEADDYIGYGVSPFGSASAAAVLASSPSLYKRQKPVQQHGMNGLSPQCSPCGPPPCPIPCYYPVPVYRPMPPPPPPPTSPPTTTSTTSTTTTTTAASPTVPPQYQHPPPYAPPVEAPCEPSVEIPLCLQYLINLATIVLGIWLLKWYCSTMAAYDQECGLDDRASGGAGNEGSLRGLSTARSSFIAPPMATISAYYDPVTNQVVLPQEYQTHQQQQFKYNY